MDENITEFVPRQLWVSWYEHKYWFLRLRRFGIISAVYENEQCSSKTYIYHI